MHILYIDDDKIDRKAFDRIMNKFAKYHWSTCDSLASAQELLLKQSFDVALIDYYLKGTTATEMLKSLGNTPSYVVSGNKSLADEKDLLSLGFAGFLPKPISDQDLLEILEKSQVSKTSIAEIDNAGDLMAYIKTISDGDESFEMEILSVIVEELPVEMDLLQKNFDRKDWIALGNLMHKMKSKISMLNANALRDEMAKYEAIAKKNSAIKKGSFDDLMLKLENLNTSVVLLFNSRKFE